MKWNPFRVDPAHPFQLVRFLSISFLVLVFGAGVVLAAVLTNTVRSAFWDKNRAFAQLLAENLNHQIFRRFTLPVVLAFGRVELKRKDQYERLDQVIESTVHSFHVLEIRIYNDQGEVVYSSDPQNVGRVDLGGDAVVRAVQEGRMTMEQVHGRSPWTTLLDPTPEERSVILRTVYPLRAEGDLRFREHPGPLLGVLEITQDVSQDSGTVVRLQISILAVTFFFCGLLYGLMVFLIRKADRVLAERARDRERLERELAQNEKLASMGRMVAAIAHEIRNPLGIIRSSAELLSKKQTDSGSASARMLGAILDESKRLSQIVTDFLDYARPRQPAMDDVDLHLVAHQVVTFLGQDGRVRLENRLPSPYLVQGDKDLLYRALYNVVGNAVQASSDGGVVVIEPCCSGGMRGVRVRDQGPGFDLSCTSRYLEPFFTTREQGTGLGLAIVHSILQAHGADLVLGNAEGGGGQVDFFFCEPC
jgi:two-component system sensor histidine kinase HydH